MGETDQIQLNSGEAELDVAYAVATFPGEATRRAMKASLWKQDYIDTLPDESFLWVEDGSKDHEGKTVPRRLRHIAVMDHLGELHAPHVISAPWRVARSAAIPAEKKSELLATVSELRDKQGIKEEAMVKESGEILNEIYMLAIEGAELELQEAERWTAAYINDLPDSSFILIESGGSKDGEGKTTPRRLRHLPVRDKNGKIDLPHLRNALARVSQVGVGSAAKAKAVRKLNNLATRYLKTQGRQAATAMEPNIYLSNFEDAEALEENIVLEGTFRFVEVAEGGLFDDERFDKYRRGDMLFFTSQLALADGKDTKKRILAQDEIEKAADTLDSRPVNWRHQRYRPIGTVVATDFRAPWLYAAGVVWTDLAPEYAKLKESVSALGVSWELWAGKRQEIDGALHLSDITFCGMALCPRDAAAVPGAAVLEMAEDDEEAMMELAEKLVKAETTLAVKETEIAALAEEKAGLTQQIADKDAEIASLKEEVEAEKAGREKAIEEAVVVAQEEKEKIDTRWAEILKIDEEAEKPKDMSDLLDDVKFESLRLARENKKLKLEAEAAGKGKEGGDPEVASGATPPEGDKAKRNLGDFQKVPK